jgi:hypothetical protein
MVLDRIDRNADIDTCGEVQAERWDGKSSFEDLTR